MGQIIGHWAFETARRMRCPFGNTQDVKWSSISSGNGLPGSIAFGSRADSRCAPFCPALGDERDRAVGGHVVQPREPVGERRVGRNPEERPRQTQDLDVFSRGGVS